MANDQGSEHVRVKVSNLPEMPIPSLLLSLQNICEPIRIRGTLNSEGISALGERYGYIGFHGQEDASIAIAKLNRIALDRHFLHAEQENAGPDDATGKARRAMKDLDDHLSHAEQATGRVRQAVALLKEESKPKKDGEAVSIETALVGVGYGLKAVTHAARSLSTQVKGLGGTDEKPIVVGDGPKAGTRAVRNSDKVSTRDDDEQQQGRNKRKRV